MKKLKRTLLLILIVFNSSCKDKSEQPVTQEIKEEIIAPKHLTIDFNFKSNKQGVFMIALNNIEVDELQKKNIQIFEDIMPSSGEDAIKAKFDADNISKNIVFHLGNKEVKEVEIKRILISYGNNQVNISTPKDLNEYLRFNRFIERDTASTTLHTKRIDGKHNPAFAIKNKLINLLIKE